MIQIPIQIPTNADEHNKFHQDYSEFVAALIKPVTALEPISERKFLINQAALTVKANLTRMTTDIDALANFICAPRVVQQTEDEVEYDYTPDSVKYRNVKPHCYGHVMYLNHVDIGLTGELGELLDCLKIYTIYDKDELNMTNLAEELGDIAFFVEATCQFFDRHPDLQAKLTSCLLANNQGMAAEEAEEAVKNLLSNAKSVIGNGGHVGNIKASIRCLLGVIHETDDQDKLNDIENRIILGNFIKLKERYEKLTFSNDAAIARADKDPARKPTEF